MQRIFVTINQKNQVHLEHFEISQQRWFADFGYTSSNLSVRNVKTREQGPVAGRGHGDAKRPLGERHGKIDEYREEPLTHEVEVASNVEI